jgi:hypothetical protein
VRRNLSGQGAETIHERRAGLEQHGKGLVRASDGLPDRKSCLSVVENLNETAKLAVFFFDPLGGKQKFGGLSPKCGPSCPSADQTLPSWQHFQRYR